MKKRLLLGVAGLLLVGTIVPNAFALNSDQDDKVANVANLPASEATLVVDKETATEPVPAPVPNNNAPNNVDNEWFNQMFEWHNSWLADAEKNVQITPEQAEAWQDHFNYMQKFHNENGFGMMGGMMMGGPNGYGMMGSYEPNGNGNYGYGMGSGMMGGYYPQQQ